MMLLEIKKPFGVSEILSPSNKSSPCFCRKAARSAIGCVCSPNRSCNVGQFYPFYKAQAQHQIFKQIAAFSVRFCQLPHILCLQKILSDPSQNKISFHPERSELPDLSLNIPHSSNILSCGGFQIPALQSLKPRTAKIHAVPSARWYADKGRHWFPHPGRPFRCAVWQNGVPGSIF